VSFPDVPDDPSAYLLLSFPNGFRFAAHVKCVKDFAAHLVAVDDREGAS
jgi:hypothetical protein